MANPNPSTINALHAKAGQTVIRHVTIAICLTLIYGCSSLAASATQDLADNLGLAMANSNDPATVEAGGPAYLLMIDGLVNADPENSTLLAQAAAFHSESGVMR